MEYGWFTQHEMAPADVEALRAIAASTAGSPYADGFPSFVADLDRRLGDWTGGLRRVLSEFRACIGGAGALLLRSAVTLNSLPATPGVPFVQLRRPIGTEAALLAVCRFLGTPIGFADWHGGDRLQNLYPLPTERTAQNASNAVHLDIHTETAFRPETPDALALLCLRADLDAVTLISDLRVAEARLEPATRALLTEPGFAFPLAAPGAGRGAGARGLTEPKAVRSGGRYHYAEALVGTTPAHQAALAQLLVAIRARSVELVLRQGDLLLLDNTHVVHGRRAYHPRYDGSDRWLQRCLIRAQSPVGT